MIEIKEVSKVFTSPRSKVEALNSVSLCIGDGDIYGIIGFSGAGKSTLVRMVNGLETPTSGSVLVNGLDVHRCGKVRLRNIRKSIGMIFQQFNLLESRTVFENIALPLRLNRTGSKEIRRRVEELLEFVELTDKKEAYPGMLSGGQKQRVGIARALATEPSILLCDEATSALDPKTTSSILHLLKKINQELNLTIVVITHEMHVIQEICNKVAVMENGKVVEEGSVLEVFGSPRHTITRNFVRTVIPDSIPEILLDGILSDERNGELLRLKFLDGNNTDSILAQVNKRYRIETNILFANISQLGSKVLGIIIIHMTGEDEELSKAKNYIREAGVEYEYFQVEKQLEERQETLRQGRIEDMAGNRAIGGVV